MCMSSCTVSYLNSFSTFLSQSVFSLCITDWFYTSLQKRPLSSVSGIKLSLCVPSNSLSNLFWFDSNKRFCLYCSVLSYCYVFSSFTSTPFCLTLNFLSTISCYQPQKKCPSQSQIYSCEFSKISHNSCFIKFL